MHGEYSSFLNLQSFFLQGIQASFFDLITYVFFPLNPVQSAEVAPNKPIVGILSDFAI